jgi:hypothetical protein
MDRMSSSGFGSTSSEGLNMIIEKDELSHNFSSMSLDGKKVAFNLILSL